MVDLGPLGPLPLHCMQQPAPVLGGLNPLSAWRWGPIRAVLNKITGQWVEIPEAAITDQDDADWLQRSWNDVFAIEWKIRQAEASGTATVNETRVSLLKTTCAHEHTEDIYTYGAGCWRLCRDCGANVGRVEPDWANFTPGGIR